MDAQPALALTAPITHFIVRDVTKHCAKRAWSWTLVVVLSQLWWAAPPVRGEAAPADTPAAQGTPQENPTPDAAAKATAAAVASGCKKALDGLVRDPNALKALSKEQQAPLLNGPTSRDLFTCLAVASDDARYCDLLSGDDKKRCASMRTDLREFKGVPKEQFKSTFMYKVCVEHGEKAACDTLRAAIAAKDASKCAGLSANMLGFCKAVASGDAAQCQGVPAGEERGTCEAFATNDESKCLKDSVNCQAAARSFVAVQKNGLDGLSGVDASAAAVVKGKSSCNEYMSALEKFCAER